MKYGIIILISLLLNGCLIDKKNTSLKLTTFNVGKNVFNIESKLANGIERLWYFNPESTVHPHKIVFVIHGAGRNAEDYLETWIETAIEHNFLVIVPEFSDKNAIFLHGRWEWAFNIGNVVSHQNIDQSKDNWYFSSIENIYQEIKNTNNNLADKYILFGHSAGGQFVHRMVMFAPDSSFDLAIAANSGWYTLPENDTRFPYGLAGAPFENETLEQSFSKEMIILLGRDDKPNQGDFRTDPDAMVQGDTRPIRGEYYFKSAKKVSELKSIPLQWKLEYVEDVGHEYKKMSLAAVPYILEHMIQ